MGKFSEQQIKWAASHDWYVDMLSGDRVMCVNEMHGDGTATLVFIDNMAELKEWAGYGRYEAVA